MEPESWKGKDNMVSKEKEKKSGDVTGEKNHCVNLNNTERKSICKSRALRNTSYKTDRKDLFSGSREMRRGK